MQRDRNGFRSLFAFYFRVRRVRDLVSEHDLKLFHDLLFWMSLRDG